MSVAKTLTERQVAAIKARLRAGDAQEHLAAAYGVSQATISQIRTGKTWYWVRPLPAKYDPTIATHPETLETVFIPPEPTPLPRWDGPAMQQSRRAMLLALEGPGIRPCLTAVNQWIGCPYGKPTLCPATERNVHGVTLSLVCVLEPGEHQTPEGYYPPAPRIVREKETAKERRARHSKVLTAKKAPARMRQYVNGVWVTRVFQDGVWTDEPEHEDAQSTAG